MKINFFHMVAVLYSALQETGLVEYGKLDAQAYHSLSLVNPTPYQPQHWVYCIMEGRGCAEAIVVNCGQ